MWDFFWLAEKVLVFQKGPCPKEIVNFSVYFIFLYELLLPAPLQLNRITAAHDHTKWNTNTRWDSRGRVTGPSHRPLPIQHTTNWRHKHQSPSEIQTRSLKNRPVAYLLLRLHGHRDWLVIICYYLIIFYMFIPNNYVPVIHPFIHSFCSLSCTTGP